MFRVVSGAFLRALEHNTSAPLNAIQCPVHLIATCSFADGHSNIREREQVGNSGFYDFRCTSLGVWTAAISFDASRLS